MLLADANWLANQLTDANLVIFKYKVQIFLFNQLVRIMFRIHFMEKQRIWWSEHSNYSN